jgi:hypothetical protein
MSNEIESRLERSLRSQVRAPTLPRSFDAAVWSRIEAEQASAAIALPTPSRGERWLAASNAIGIAVAILIACWLGLRNLAGFDVGFTIPDLATLDVVQIVKLVSWPITGLALGVGLMFTSLGQRLRSLIG